MRDRKQSPNSEAGGGCEGTRRTAILMACGLIVLFLASAQVIGGGGAGSGSEATTAIDGGGAGSGLDINSVMGGGAGSGADGGGAGSGVEGGGAGSG